MAKDYMRLFAKDLSQVIANYEDEIEPATIVSTLSFISGLHAQSVGHEYSASDFTESVIEEFTNGFNFNLTQGTVQ